MVDICYLLLLTLQLRFGISDKDTFFTVYMDMKAHQLHVVFHQVVISSLLQELMLLLWYGRVI